METKICSKCGIEKTISEFYKHPNTSDGYSNKCKNCTKQYVQNRYSQLSKNEEWVEKERIRGRSKYKRLGYGTNNFKNIRLVCKTEANISKMLKRRGYDTNGKEAHHWNYNLPYSILLLSKRSHKCLHKYITVNYEDKFCYTNDGIRIDSKELATKIFNSILKENGYNEDLEFIEIKPSKGKRNLTVEL